jgi:hypothetical protein
VCLARFTTAFAPLRIIHGHVFAWPNFKKEETE